MVVFSEECLNIADFDSQDQSKLSLGPRISSKSIAIIAQPPSGNIEAGVLFDSPNLARDIETHFQSLIDLGLLEKLRCNP